MRPIGFVGSLTRDAAVETLIVLAFELGVIGMGLQGYNDHIVYNKKMSDSFLISFSRAGFSAAWPWWTAGVVALLSSVAIQISA